MKPELRYGQPTVADATFASGPAFIVVRSVYDAKSGQRICDEALCDNGEFGDVTGTWVGFTDRYAAIDKVRELLHGREG